MTQYRSHLPQMDGRLFLTDGGIETTLIYREGLDLPYFAAVDLLRSERGRYSLRRYYHRHASIARRNNVGFILESATWRASHDWGEKLELTPDALALANKYCVGLLVAIRRELATHDSPMVISGCIGPRGDGYDPGELMSESEAERYHRAQIETLAETEVDLVTGVTMTNIEEAIGIVRAARAVNLPVVISFTVETDGKLPTGERLQEAVERVDLVTNRGPAYYMINCAHPTHFQSVLTGEPWVQRIRGIRANASKCSHAELDAAQELDCGNPDELGADYAALTERLPWINVLGGCCGTDERHIEAICASCLEAA